MCVNELEFNDLTGLNKGIQNIWRTMRGSIECGCCRQGNLPGCLKVKQRAAEMYRKLNTEESQDPLQVLDWVNLYALCG